MQREMRIQGVVLAGVLVVVALSVTLTAWLGRLNASPPTQTLTTMAPVVAAAVPGDHSITFRIPQGKQAAFYSTFQRRHPIPTEAGTGDDLYTSRQWVQKFIEEEMIWKPQRRTRVRAAQEAIDIPVDKTEFVAVP
ncbi:hypothetical protein LCGC14_0325710 [marine sediment metagenome]|uniref:Uncharacterized protein n=1 Tax=marine sediment metagenome TaxID=412755 RepID=A0A0F9THU8_9ZZZZ